MNGNNKNWRNGMKAMMTMVTVVFAAAACGPDRVTYDDDFCMETGGFDEDGDGIRNECDTCPSVGDPTNLDSDNDGRGDVCDPCPNDQFDRCQSGPDGDGDVDGDVDGDGDTDGDVDMDGDTWSPPEDCDDSDPSVHPGAEEVCDGVDNDCDGFIDEGDCCGDSSQCIPTERQCSAWDTWGGQPSFAFSPGGEDAAVLLSDGCYLFAASNCADFVAAYGGDLQSATQAAHGRSDVVLCREVCWAL